MASSSGIRSRLARAVGLPRADRRLAARALVEIARADALVSLVPFRFWRRELVETVRSSGASADAHSAESARVVRLFESALRSYPRRITCLRRSLALRRLLARDHIPATLRVGVRRAPTFEAHAWIEVDGRAVGEPHPPDAGFVPLPLDAVAPAALARL